MSAGVVNEAIEIAQGASFGEPFRLWIDVVGRAETIPPGTTAQIIAFPPKGSSVKAPAEWTTANGKLDLADNIVTPLLEPADTTALALGDWPFNLFLTYPDGFIERVVFGVFRVERGTK